MNSEEHYKSAIVLEVDFDASQGLFRTTSEHYQSESTDSNFRTGSAFEQSFNLSKPTFTNRLEV